MTLEKNDYFLLRGNTTMTFHGPSLALCAISIIAGFVCQSARAEDEPALPPTYPSVETQTSPGVTPHAAEAKSRLSSEPHGAIPEEYIALIRATLIALNQANITGDYSVLYGLGTPEFMKVTNADALAKAFAEFRHQNLDLNAAAVAMPKLIAPPKIDDKGNLRLTGTLAAKPVDIRFDLACRKIDGRWRYAGLGVTASPHGTPPAQVRSEQSAPADVSRPRAADNKR
jgi:hypothetical protein